MEDVDQTLIIANEAFSAVASQHPDMGFYRLALLRHTRRRIAKPNQNK